MPGTSEPTNPRDASERHTDPIAAKSTPAVDELRLRRLGNEETVISAKSDGDRLVIGTHPNADVRLDDPTVSSFHCAISFGQGRCWIADLRSRNGTIVNGVRIEKAELPRLATLQLGNTSLRVEGIPKADAGGAAGVRSFGRLIGSSAEMQRVFARLAQAAASEATVLIEGETGTGKELAAESLHQASTRASGPLIVVDCASIPAELLESELFGHRRGAFTGATRDRAGAFHEAAGGSVFLDEIGELPAELQPKLLRVLERHHVKAIGANQYEQIDVRVIAATNRSLCEDVNLGTFRSDLYYRLAVLTVRIPPLRERPDDIPALVAHLLAGIPGKHAERERVCAADFTAALQRLPWPGNVRELRNYLERYLAFQEEPEAPPQVDLEAAQSALIDTSLPYRAAREKWGRALEREYLVRKLAEHNGEVHKMANAIGLNRVYVHRLLKRLGIR